MAKAAYLSFTGSMKDVLAKLNSMKEDDFTALKASALSVAARREKGAK